MSKSIVLSNYRIINDDWIDYDHNNNIIKTNESFYYNDINDIIFNFTIDFDFTEMKDTDEEIRGIVKDYKFQKMINYQPTEYTTGINDYLEGFSYNPDFIDMFAVIHIGNTQISSNFINDILYYKGEALIWHSRYIVYSYFLNIINENDNTSRYVNIKKFNQSILLESANLLKLSETEQVAIFLYGTQFVDDGNRNIKSNNSPITCNDTRTKKQILSLHNIIEPCSTGLLAVITFVNSAIKITKLDYNVKGIYNNKPNQIHQIIKDNYFDEIIKIEPSIGNIQEITNVINGLEDD
jgi:hypothetical protein